VLEAAEIPANMYRFSLGPGYEPRAYCVQYRETDFDFISRLMEEEGIFFFFEHTEAECVLVIGDSADVHPELPEDPILRYRESDAGMLSEETITGFRYARTLRTGAVALKEFDFKKPSLLLKAVKDAGSKKESKFESYDYPGEYHVQKLGDRLVKVRLEEERAESYLGMAETDCRRLESGYKFARRSPARRAQHRLPGRARASHRRATARRRWRGWG
jgi:type VI secretion system secreted protein VgrG